MVYEYKKVEMTPMFIAIEQEGQVIELNGEFADVRIDKTTIPEGKEWYQIRHSDDDDMDAAALKNGCVAVNFFGTFICDPIEGLQENEELEILDWSYE